MAKGIVSTFDAKRGVGFVLQSEGDRLPFTSRDLVDRHLSAGDSVEYLVIGGKIGIRATAIRRAHSH